MLATFGTHGDLHPFIAVALRLRDAGFEPVIATSSVFRFKVESEGIAFHRLRPEQEAIEQELGLTKAQLVRKVAQRPDFILRRMLLPKLRESYEDSLEVLAGAALVVTHTTALATKIAAEKLRLPHIAVVLQPMALLSVFDPPELAPFPALMRWIYRLGPSWTSRFLHLMKRLSRPWAQPIDDLRREVGLPPVSVHPFFEGQFNGDGVIALYSQVLGTLQPDHPARMSIVGFAFYDAETGGDVSAVPGLKEFLDAGDPPLVFTLGTSAIHDAEDFIRTSLAATAILGMRAVFVLDEQTRARWQSHASQRVLICSYAQYSMLFPRAAVIVHHGGVGTTAQALRTGRPQVVVPYLVDQPDNAARVERLGVGLALSLRQYRDRRVVRELRKLIDDPAMAVRAREVADIIATEDGAAAAVRMVADVLANRDHESEQHRRRQGGQRG